jgi:hypothetical protein
MILAAEAAATSPSYPLGNGLGINGVNGPNNNYGVVSS